MLVPGAVICGGALLLVPLSPCLIFGWGPFPALGVAGGGWALVTYYAGLSAARQKDWNHAANHFKRVMEQFADADFAEAMRSKTLLAMLRNQISTD